MKYKEGDRVKIKSLDWYNRYTNGTEVNCKYYPFSCHMKKYCGQIMTISIVGGFSYDMIEDDGIYSWTDEMIEGLVEEETLIERVDDKGLPFNEWLSHKGAFHVPDGYELKDENGNVINARKIVLEKKKKGYPKTYEECCKVLGYNDRETYRVYHNKANEIMFETLYRLKVCRDSYWQIAGEEMGLDKPWEPDYDSGVNKYGIICMNGVVQESNPTTNWERHLNKIFDFPTPEMRDAFYENFKELIDQCKELL